MRLKLRRLFGSLAFFALLGAAVFCASRVVERKESHELYGPFLEHAREFDVLFIGDSHMSDDVFPMELWRDYGIASYNIAGRGNTLPLSYWVLMCALEYAQPKVLVIDVDDCEMPYAIPPPVNGDPHTALDWIPLSRTKLAAIEALMNDPVTEYEDANGVSYRELRWEFVFKLGKYHSRWSELTRDDFFPTPGVQKGAQARVDVAVPLDYTILDDLTMLEEDAAGYAHLRLMIEECQRRGIDVLLTHLPYPTTSAEQMAANTIVPLADEYGVDYIDFVNLDQVVDYRADMADLNSHLNPSGARKVTDYLGRYLAAHYGVPDRRGDGAYAAWNDDYAAYLEYKKALLREQTDPKNVLMLLHDESFSARVEIGAGSPFYADETLMRLLQNVAREHIYEEDMFAKWSDGLFPLERLDEAAASGAAYAVAFNRAPKTTLEFAGGGSLSADSPDLFVEAYDAATGETVARWTFDL